MEKHSTRSSFRESLGATCKNPQWSWSWVNHEQKSVYFGASTVHEYGNTQLILGFDWETNIAGRKNPGYSEAIENINLILKSGYTLFTFRQIEEVVNKQTGRVRITDFEQELERRYLEQREDGWHAFLIGDFDAKSNFPNSKTNVVFLEGSRVPIVGSRIERNSRARDACLKLHGTLCSICNFDFEEVYGALGKGFIHVHHLKPIGDSMGPHQVDPKTDLRPVCPNCHAMIHRGGENRSIEVIRSLISKKQPPEL